MHTFQEKKTIAEGLLKTVNIEKTVLESEITKGLVEENKIAEVQAEVLLKQADASKDLKRAEPALVRAMAALESLDRRDLGNCKTMNKGKNSVHVKASLMICHSVRN